MSEADVWKITTAHPLALIQEMPAPVFETQFANGSLVKVTKQMSLRFFLAGSRFEATFILMSTLGPVLIGMSFFVNYSVTIDVKNHSVHLPDI